MKSFKCSENINTLRLYLKEKSEAKFAANQLLEMHSEASKRKPIMKLGVDRDKARVFLNAIDGKVGSVLISIDINDCKNAVNSENWEFVQQDLRYKFIVIKKPILKSGIDILYVDSLHVQSHVMKEFMHILNI